MTDHVYTERALATICFEQAKRRLQHRLLSCLSMGPRDHAQFEKAPDTMETKEDAEPSIPWHILTILPSACKCACDQFHVSEDV